MCTGDLSVYTFQWVPDDLSRPYPKTNAKKKCVNWELLDKSAMERQVGFTPILLRETGEKAKVHM